MKNEIGGNIFFNHAQHRFGLWPEQEVEVRRCFRVTNSVRMRMLKSILARQYVNVRVD